MIPLLRDTSIAASKPFVATAKRGNMICSDSSASSTIEYEHASLSETSWSEEAAQSSHERPALHKVLSDLFDENTLAKPYRAASRVLQGFDPAHHGFPEIVPQQGPKLGRWEIREPEFWTCGFFPGILYTLLERSIRYPGSIRAGSPGHGSSMITRRHLLPLCKSWSEPLHAMASRTDTHDIGFIIMPALRRDFELFGSERSLGSIIQAAHNLATRYVLAAGAIRSWDCLLKKDITVTDMENNLLTIIDSMCNLDLLFYAAAQTGEQRLADIASSHATTLLKTHLRQETASSILKRGYQGQLYSTCHVANIDPKTGDLKWRRTAQGYTDDSTWSRGQAWAILGYAQTYNWTKKERFLDAACGCAEYFLHRLETSPSCVELPVQCSSGHKSARRGRHVPLWDFDAPIENPREPLRDSSAGVIAANGMLLISQALAGLGRYTLSGHFFDASIEIVKDTLDVCLATEKVVMTTSEDGGKSVKVEDAVLGTTFDALLKHGTANNNENARRRYANHGLVYGDYYLVEFGNLLLSMGLV
ncbi:related to glucuronyl hydrolase [Fusarium proliferatum]|nr:related to glucuronyl hydrolase [Fusarium proliferatum]